MVTYWLFSKRVCIESLPWVGYPLDQNLSISDIVNYLRLLRIAGFDMNLQNIKHILIDFSSNVEQALASNIHTTKWCQSIR